MRWIRSLVYVTCIIFLCVRGTLAHAHPADELCGPASPISPSLCRQLAEIDGVASITDDNGPAPYSVISAARVYFQIGIKHVYPNGWDHIFFVFAIILSSASFWISLKLISLFTLAHALTIALASLNIIQWEGTFLEILIALTIVWAGLECIYVNNPKNWQARQPKAWLWVSNSEIWQYHRQILVFSFGLLHGLGLAGAITERSLPDEQFLIAFFAFNTGIEVAQIGCAIVGLVGILALNKLTGLKTEIFGGLVVTLFGLLWTVERLLGWVS